MYTILIVDDDAALRDTLADLLVLEGYNVIQASNGKAGLAFIRSHKLDLVIADNLMPEMTGIELLKIIRADQDLSTLSVALLSGDISNLAPEDAQKLGANIVIIKPFEASEFISIITELL